MLRPPVEPMLAQARESVPGVLPGGLAFEAKFDGYRALLFNPNRAGGAVLLQSRRGSLIQRHFPDLVAAARQLPDGLVLDGELVVWSGDRLSFEALQRRAVSGIRTVDDLAAKMPAHFIAFDVLQADSRELLTEPYERRRAVLENLFREHALTPPWTLCPMTTDPALAQEWLTSWTRVPGVEGVVIKGLRQRYVPGARAWFKVRRRETTEAVIGAVTGSLAQPQLLVLGRYDADHRLRPVGRTTPLRPDAARQLADHLTAYGPGHPWTGVRFRVTWGSREILDPTLVVPALVAEVSADTAVDRGACRHPLRYVRTAPGRHHRRRAAVRRRHETRRRLTGERLGSGSGGPEGSRHGVRQAPGPHVRAAAGRPAEEHRQHHAAAPAGPG
ncbi:ATP-dependent DNA ligase [Streptomyces sp. ISL-10]|uniref:ATP-dependent DNA ligase n=1 Tax=Streptomyces sp. ISL-10 TaxID=2819172 RepID=UPI0027E4EB4E|nr:ATP-dependent DNA ligase [Streptomyces sp. ISL-10]